MTALLQTTLLSFLLIGWCAAKSRTCRIVYPERPNDAPKTAFLFDGKKSTAVHLPSMTLSEVIELPGGPLSLCMTRASVQDPKTLPAAAPKVIIPENVMDFYLIILPDANNAALPIKLNLVDAGNGKLLAGQTLWYNFTNHRILAKLGTTDFQIPPLSRAISQAPTPASGYYLARFAYQENATAAPAPITEQSWWHDAASRHVGFMVDTGGKLPKIYYFRDFRMPGQDNDSEQAVETE